MKNQGYTARLIYQDPSNQNLWLYHNYIIDRLRNNYEPCQTKNCNCHIKAKKSDEDHKLLSDLYFAMKITEYDITPKPENDYYEFWYKIRQMFWQD